MSCFRFCKGNLFLAQAEIRPYRPRFPPIPANPFQAIKPIRFRDVSGLVTAGNKFSFNTAPDTSVSSTRQNRSTLSTTPPSMIRRAMTGRIPDVTKWSIQRALLKVRDFCIRKRETASFSFVSDSGTSWQLLSFRYNRAISTSSSAL